MQPYAGCTEDQYFDLNTGIQSAYCKYHLYTAPSSFALLPTHFYSLTLVDSTSPPSSVDPNRFHLVVLRLVPDIQPHLKCRYHTYQHLCLPLFPRPVPIFLPLQHPYNHHCLSSRRANHLLFQKKAVTSMWRLAHVLLPGLRLQPVASQQVKYHTPTT